MSFRVSVEVLQFQTRAYQVSPRCNCKITKQPLGRRDLIVPRFIRQEEGRSDNKVAAP